MLHSVTIVDGATVTPDAWVLLSPAGVVGRGVAGHGDGNAWSEHVSADVEVIDASEVAGPGAILTPGFIDLHGHGGAGVSYDESVEAITRARALHRAHGTTRAVISLVTAHPTALLDRIRAVAELTATDPEVLGSHLEGPFLAASHKGAHAEALLIPPTPDLLAELFDAGAGTIRQITLAPDVPGGIEAITQTAANGVVAAVGHTGADAGLTHAAIDAGATLLTHAFNGMNGIHHRAPGPVVAALSDTRVVLEVIADGVHVDLDLVAVVFRAAPGRIALVTDAMAAAGAADGRYTLGELDVDVLGGVARLANGGAIAGSTLLQDVALRNVVAAGVPLSAAVDALTSTPARVLGIGDRFGELAPGYVADAVLLTADLDVVEVWRDAQRVVSA